MTPAARVAAAIAVLDRVLEGAPAEQALTRWARDSRYAGSGDRAAIRDHVYDALRRRRSAAWCGGAETGRGLMLGLLRQQGARIEALFDGSPYGPEPVRTDESGLPLEAAPRAVRLDMPDWLLPLFEAALGDGVETALALLRDRAGVFLRVNARAATTEAAQAALAADGIATAPVPDMSFALQVTENARKLSGSRAYLDGLVELQDPASQRAVAALPLRDGMAVLDFCAGGGGKTLAMAARAELVLTAHDADPRRMRDLPPRAARAGIAVRIVDTAGLADLPPQDLVLVDAPCSGSGTWRRSPDARWRLTPGRLRDLTRLQATILARAAAHVRPGGGLAYATCSVFTAENEDRVTAFLAERPDWGEETRMRLVPGPWCDGFHLSVLRRPL
ncbi:MAG: 16S rRNA (cytosine967-C5)-methyltransferase [Rhodobacteraceae bacterium HLUCCA08]|nr:MAG: 16S rRNA (cytosine967-C5)-methyltransferase [Rhodobacteraceae bacterium HLUCCA08]